MGINKERCKGIINTVIAAFLCLLACGCVSTVLVRVPPSLNISQYNSIGIIDFNSNIEDLSVITTQRFLNQVQTYQPDSRFLPLGNPADALASIGKERIDSEAVRLIGQKYDVRSIITGDIKISEPTPQLSLGKSFFSMSAKVSVNGNATVTLWDAQNGTIIWTRTKLGSWSLARMKMDAGGFKSTKIQDKKSRYQDVICDLMKWVTYDLRERYEKVRAK